MGAPGIPLTKGKVYTIKAVDNVAGVIHLDNEWMLPSSYMSIAKDKDLTKEEKPEFKVGDIVQSPQKTKYKITKVDGGLAFGFLLDSDGKPSHETEIALASMSYLQSAGYKVVDSELPTLADIIKPIKKFKVTHAERPDIPQVFNIGDKVSFRGKMYFVKYVNPEDHMVQIELAKIRHGKVTGVVTGAIVNVKPDTILPWGVKPNGKVIAVGGDEWNKNTAVRLEYDYAKVKPLLENIANESFGKRGSDLDKLPEKFDPLNETTGEDYQRTQTLARVMSIERASQLLVERGLMNDMASARAAIKNIDGELWRSWKDSSTTTDGMILQVAAAEELGGRLYEHDGLKKNQSIKDADRVYLKIGGFDGVKAYLRGKWETTQYLLDKANIQTMKVYRNIEWNPPFMGSKKNRIKAKLDKYSSSPSTFTRYPNAVISRNGCQSCTTSAGVANDWGGNIVFRVVAPRTAALSIPAYGINIHTEHECVIAGTAWAAYDVWNKPAPTFENFPLNTTNMVGKMYTSPDNPNMPKMKTDLSKLLSKKGLYSGKSDAYWKKYGSQGLEDKFKPGNKVKWDYPGNDPDNVYTVVGKNDYGIKLKNSQGTNLQAKPEDLTILSKFDQIDLKKDGLDKKPKFSSGDKISGVSGSNFADTEFTVNSVNRNGTMDVTSEYGTPYTGVKPHLFQISNKVKGKFKVGDTISYGAGVSSKFEIVKGPYKSDIAGVGPVYDIKNSNSGSLYHGEYIPSYVTKIEPETIKVSPIVPQANKRQTLEVGSTYENPGTGTQFKITKVENGVPYGIKLGLGKTPTAAEVQLGFGVKWKKVESNQHKSKFYYGKLGNGDILYSSLNSEFKYKVTNVTEKGFDLIPINKFSGKESPHHHQNISYSDDLEYMFTSAKEAQAADQKVDSPETKDKVFKTSEKYQKSLDKFKVGQTVYSKYQSGKGYVITGFMKNGDLDTKEINLKTGNPTDHYAQLVPDLIYTSKEDAKKSPESKWDKND